MRKIIVNLANYSLKCFNIVIKAIIIRLAIRPKDVKLCKYNQNETIRKQ